MHVVRIFTGPDGQSHFEDLEVPMSFHLGANMTDPVPATVFAFYDSPEGDSPFHNAKRRQFVVTLSGVLEAECGDGSKRHFYPGDVLLADDLTGQGHKSRGATGARSSVWIGLADDVDITPWRIAAQDKAGG